MKKLLILVLVLMTVIACKEKGSTTPEVVKGEINKIKFCTKEAKLCPDGNSVTRNLENNCEFDPCPTHAEKKTAKKEPMMCTADVKECSDGSYVGRDHYNNCKFKDCPNGEKTNPKI